MNPIGRLCHPSEYIYIYNENIPHYIVQNLMSIYIYIFFKFAKIDQIDYF